MHQGMTLKEFVYSHMHFRMKIFQMHILKTASRQPMVHHWQQQRLIAIPARPLQQMPFCGIACSLELCQGHSIAAGTIWKSQCIWNAAAGCMARSSRSRSVVETDCL